MLLGNYKSSKHGKIPVYTFGFVSTNKEDRWKIFTMERIISNLFEVTQDEERLINFLKNKKNFNLQKNINP